MNLHLRHPETNEARCKIATALIGDHWAESAEMATCKRCLASHAKALRSEGEYARKANYRESHGDLTGQVFADLTVERFLKVGSQGRMWVCRCICGHARVTTTFHLRDGITKRCDKCTKRVLNGRAARILRQLENDEEPFRDTLLPKR